MARIVDPDEYEIDPIITVMGNHILTDSQYKFLKRMMDESWYPYDKQPFFIHNILGFKSYTDEDKKILNELREEHINHLENIK